MGVKIILYLSVLWCILNRSEANKYEKKNNNITSENKTKLIFLTNEEFDVNKTIATDTDQNDHRLSKRATSKFNPCPDVYEYRMDYRGNFGWITLRPENYPDGQNTILLVVEYSLPVSVSFEGSLDIETSLNQISRVLARGGDVHYRLNYPIQNPTPWINSISVNGRIICFGVSDFGSYYNGPFSLSRTVNLPNFIRRPIRPVMKPVTSAPSPPIISTTSKYSNTDENRYVSPCPKIFEYKQDKAGNYYGYINLNKFPFDGNVEVKVNFAIDKKLNTNNTGKLRKANNGNFYTVIFPTQDPIPRITLIEINGISICQGKTDGDELWKRYSVVHMSTIHLSTPMQPNVTKPKPVVVELTTELVTTRKVKTMYDNILKYKDICGKSSRIQTLVSFGSQANPGDFPWLTPLFQISDEGGLDFICGGSLVSTKHVLTAAHCIREDADNYAVIPGLHDLRKILHTKLYPVDKAIKHPDYGKMEETTADADIAIIGLQEEVTFTRRIKPICLPIEAIPLVKKEGLIAGWGDTEYNRRSRVVREATLPVVSTESCVKHDSRYSFVSSNRTFCAGGGRSSPCPGDSGGGFFMEQGGKMYLQGIVSLSISTHGSSCDLFTYSVYAKVDNYVEWINNNIK